MGLIATIVNSMSSEAQRLARLAALSGESERLATSLGRHAELCTLPRIKDGLKALAVAESTDAKVLRNLILEYDVCPAPPPVQVGAEANNWARLNADLEAEVELVRALNGAIAEWEGAKPELAAGLRGLVESKEQTLSILRGLALRCDPQALD